MSGIRERDVEKGVGKWWKSVWGKSGGSGGKCVGV